MIFLSLIAKHKKYLPQIKLNYLLLALALENMKEIFVTVSIKRQY